MKFSLALRCWGCSLIVIAGILFCTLAGMAETKPAGPAIQFAETTLSFGTAMAGEMVTHEFVFTNTGDATLVISGVYPTCGCTTVNEWTREVAPGQTGRISLQLDSTRFAGLVTKTIIVMSNDQAHHNLVLSFRGMVKKPMDLTPPMIILKPAIDGELGEAGIVNIKNNLTEPVTLGKPVCDNPAFTAELKTIVPEREFQLTVRVVKAVGGAMLQGNVTMQTGSSRTPSVLVPVLILPQAQITLVPPVITLPFGPLPMATNLAVTLSNQGRHLLAIADAKIDAGGVGVKFKETQPGLEFVFTLLFPEGFTLSHDRETTLTITTKNSEIPVITVPLRLAGQSITGSGVALPPSPPILPAPAATKP
jgi:hypothetical protein